MPPLRAAPVTSTFVVARGVVLSAWNVIVLDPLPPGTFGPEQVTPAGRLAAGHAIVTVLVKPPLGETLTATAPGAPPWVMVRLGVTDSVKSFPPVFDAQPLALVSARAFT